MNDEKKEKIKDENEEIVGLIEDALQVKKSAKDLLKKIDELDESEKEF